MGVYLEIGWHTVSLVDTLHDSAISESVKGLPSEHASPFLGCCEQRDQPVQPEGLSTSKPGVSFRWRGVEATLERQH